MPYWVPFMNREHGSKLLKTRFGKWAAFLAVPLFLLGTGIFSFLWNVPLDKLAVLRTGMPPSVLFRSESLPEKAAIPMPPELLPGIRPLLEHYAAAVDNAGHIDFHTYASPEVQICMEGLSIGMNSDLVVFNFETRYGFSMQTSRKPNAYDRTVYQWLKSIAQTEEDQP
ncbi:hypothetical protein HMPREF3039_00664 [Akkermansia sp. KLE1798]|nr:hypothetical protein HMPREF3039_00664 [Akkermansia sp. KLE1798]